MTVFDSPNARCEAIHQRVRSNASRSAGAREQDCAPDPVCPLAGDFPAVSGHPDRDLAPFPAQAHCPIDIDKGPAMRSLFRHIRPAAFGLLLAASLPAQGAMPLAEPSRGELLYSLHCVACHSREIHWRDKRVVRHWASLVAEVDRWQAVDRLGWDRQDIEATAVHLNRLYYHFPVETRP